MVEINLLPWRAMFRSENVKRKKLFLICGTILLFLWMIAHAGLDFIVQTYDAKIAALKNQLAELTSQTLQNPVDSSLAVAEQIHANQVELLHLLKIVEQEQGMITWATLVSQRNNIILTGSANSSSSLAQFVNTYNTKNKALPMSILSIKNNAITATQFRLRVLRVSSPFLEREKNNDTE